MTRAIPVIERLERLSMPEPNSGCVLWLGYIDSKGYGRFTVSAQARGKMAHIVAYELYVGPVPAGMELDHLCRNTACRAVWHLEPVTHRVNILRGIGIAAVNAAKTECIHGHSFNAWNTYRDPRGYRSCRTCQADADQRRRGQPKRPRGVHLADALTDRPSISHANPVEVARDARDVRHRKYVEHLDACSLNCKNGGLCPAGWKLSLAADAAGWRLSDAQQAGAAS